MSLTLRSSSNLFNENERLRRKRLTTTTLNRFLSFNENKSSAAENRRRLLQKSEPNLIELLEEDDDDIDDNQGLCHECDTCSKIFASEYGLNYHINMHHPNQSILCSICHITFRSHRSLKTHQQRRHSNQQTKSLANRNSLPNYNYLSSYLVLAFSSRQFPILAKIACEQQRLPLGDFSSQIFKCSSCSISFPCQRTLTYHVLNQHEQYQYKVCQELISNLIEQIEYNQRTVTNDDDDDIDSIRYKLSQQASHFGLINKQLANQIQTYKTEQNILIYPVCQHEKRTCANLCLKYLSKYDQLTRNYSYQIPIIPKGSLFSQGSIVSVSSVNTLYSLNSLKTNDSNELTSNARQKRKTFKQNDELPVQIKRRNLSNTTTNSRTNRTNSNKTPNGKQHVEQTKINDSKSFSIDQSSSAQRKFLPKDDYIRSPSMSSNSSTSTRSSIPKSSTQRLSKRTLSPPIPSPSEKRRRTRERRTKTSSSSAAAIRIDDELDIEQENGDDDDDDDDEDNDIDDDIIPIKLERSKLSQRSSKQRQASSGSIEYVQILSNDQQLNNIENLKSKVNDEDIIVCRSPPSVKKVLPTPTKTHARASVNGAKKSDDQQSPTNDEHVRVRCKICGEILEGRSRFSKHVIAMHPNLLKKNLPDTKPQPTAIVR